MPDTVYACVHVQKEIEQDVYDKGCIEPRCTTMSESVNIVAHSLKDLLKAIGDRYGLEIDDLFVPVDEEVHVVSYNRLEVDDNSEPDQEELLAWQCRKQKMWLADYYFQVEKRTVSSLTLSDIQASGIKFHG